MKNIILLAVIFCLFSCKNHRLGKELSGFIGTEITIPDNMQLNYKGVDTSFQQDVAPLKIVMWYDSLGCAACQIHKIYEWDDIVSYARNMSEAVTPIFIFSPPQSELHSVKLALRTTRFGYPVYVDKDNLFSKNNPGIPSDKRMHTFLLDEDNRVVLVGNPVNNEKLWHLYEEQIENKNGCSEECSGHHTH